MRLIDEEKLMEDIQKTITEQYGTIDWMNLIYRQPTAYDVEKVVEQLDDYLFDKYFAKKFSFHLMFLGLNFLFPSSLQDGLL